MITIKQTVFDSKQHLAVLLCLFSLFGSTSFAQTTLEKSAGSVRVASFNVALNRNQEGQLLEELKTSSPAKVRKVAEIIQRVRPDVLLINEIDFDGGKSLDAFCKNFLEVGQRDQKGIEYPFRYSTTVNTGVDSSVDLNGDRRVGSAKDAFGYGRFPGQYGMAVLSKHPIELEQIRTFQTFLWKDMPNALIPQNPETGGGWYSDEAIEVFRLSSKSHWDVPIRIDDRELHFLVCHPTPPVFDGKEDRNGRRNHDEIRLWADYVSKPCKWLYDDQGVTGGLAADQLFVIAGDLNADPNDGDSYEKAIAQLLEHEQIQVEPIPSSRGGSYYAKEQGRANLKQKGDPQHDTADFNDGSVGNVRIDYVLPSKQLKVSNSGVFWPEPKEAGGNLVDGSDHRMVWIDLELPK